MARGKSVKSKEFKAIYDSLLPKVKERENFHASHLMQLEILCNLHCRLMKLEKHITEHGWSEIIITKWGESTKPSVEATMYPKVLSEIRHYSKLLGLILVKDNSKTIDDKIKDEWK